MATKKCWWRISVQFQDVFWGGCWSFEHNKSPKAQSSRHKAGHSDPTQSSLLLRSIGICKRWSHTGPPLPPWANRPRGRVRVRQSRSRRARWCLRAPPDQSDNRGSGEETGWWSCPTPEEGLRRSGSPRKTAAKGQSRPCLPGWRTGRPPGGILWGETETSENRRNPVWRFSKSLKRCDKKLCGSSKPWYRHRRVLQAHFCWKVYFFFLLKF